MCIESMFVPLDKHIERETDRVNEKKGNKKPLPLVCTFTNFHISFDANQRSDKMNS